MFQKEVNRFKKEMMLFYVEEDNNRFPSAALCIGFDGVYGYQSAEPQLPINFEAMACFLKKHVLTVQESDNSIFFLDILMNSAIQNNLTKRKSDIKTISDFKFGDPICLGGDRNGYSLGQLTVNVKVWGE